MKEKTISGFSKLSKRGKIKWIVENFFKDPESVMNELKSYWLSNDEQQKILDGFSENTISNFYLPYGVAPNFVINDKPFAIPMVIEESSVVAAASHAAKFWMQRGGFKAQVVDVCKIGQVHFYWRGAPDKLRRGFDDLKAELIKGSDEISANMRKRGGGILDIELRDFNGEEPGLYQLLGKFDTCDSMGANFINTILEDWAKTLRTWVVNYERFDEDEREIEVLMSILSNYTPECRVKAWVECPVEDLGTFALQMKAEEFADRFSRAVRIARIDPYRAATHNKGIFNGIDAVVLATGNDFRAIEASGHSYAARDGQYRSLSDCSVKDGVFKFWLELPLAVGTVGGLTKLHPIAKRSLELLGNPGARELMMIIACTGLAQNFAAVKSLITTGIQHGHMKMHLQNMLVHFNASETESTAAYGYFEDKVISFSAVREFLDTFRKRDQKIHN